MSPEGFKDIVLEQMFGTHSWLLPKCSDENVMLVEMLCEKFQANPNNFSVNYRYNQEIIHISRFETRPHVSVGLDIRSTRYTLHIGMQSPKSVQFVQIRMMRRNREGIKHAVTYTLYEAN